MDLLEIRPDFASDPDGRSLSTFLVAQRALERATQRRVWLVHATALLGVPVWLTALGYVWGFERGLALAAFAVSLVALALAVGHEIRSRRAARAAEQHLAVYRTPL